MNLHGTAADPLAALTTALKLLVPNQPATNLKHPPLNELHLTNIMSSNSFVSPQRAGFHLPAIPDDKDACLEYTKFPQYHWPPEMEPVGTCQWDHR